MRKGRTQALLLVLLLLGSSFSGVAQDDPFYKATWQWLSFAYTRQWDSALHSAQRLKTLVIKEYGPSSLHYSLVLTGILGQTWFAKKNNDSAIACYQAGLDLFRLRQDTTSVAYKEIAVQWRILRFWQTEDTVTLVKDSAYIQQKLAEINAWKNSPAATEWAKQLIRQRLKDTARRRTVSPMVDTSYLIRLRKAFIPPWYANRVLMESQLLVKGTADTLDDRYLSLLFDRERMNVRMTSLVTNLVPERSAADTLPEIVFEYLFAGTRLLKTWLTDRQQEATRQIVYNLNFRNDESPEPTQPAPGNEPPPSPFSDRNIPPRTLIEHGRTLLANKRYADAERVFRKLITRLHADEKAHTSEYQESMAGFCTALMGLGNYREAADSLLMLSRVALSHQSEALLRSNETNQLLYKQAMSLILELLYTCLRQLPTDRDTLSATIFRLQLQLQNEVLDNMADLLQKVRDSGNLYFTTYFRLYAQVSSAIDSSYMLPVNRRHLNRDSIDRIMQVLNSFIFNNTWLNRSRDTAISIRQLTRDQAPGTANIAFVRFHFRPTPEEDSIVYAAFLLRRQDSYPVFLPLCGEKALQSLLLDQKGRKIEGDELSRKLYDPASPAARQLYRLIWAPLEPWLTRTRNINFSTSGLLNNLSFHAIYTDKGYLLYRYSLHRYLRLKDAATPKNSPPQPWPVHLWGNMRYSPATADAFPSLGSQEMDSLRRSFRQQHPHLYEGDSATEEAFRRQAPQLSGIVHIATHGIYFPYDKRSRELPLPAGFLAANGNPFLRCGLAFSGVNRYWTTGVPEPGRQDGFLNGSEIARLDLHHVQLVTLSACETGLGDVTGDEGNWGLQRAFKLAGAQNLLVSLWPVSPAVTSRLLSLFYANWLQGLSFSDALRKAEETLQQNDGKQHALSPYRWAGFVLIE